MEPSLLSQSVWLGLSLETRAKLAKLFDFPEKGSVQVVNGPTGSVVISDGYGYDHLKLITTKKMQEILNTKSDNFYSLFDTLVKNLDDIVSGTKLAEDVIAVEKAEEQLIADLPAPKPRGRPRKVK
jgi:hypothetical protein